LNSVKDGKKFKRVKKNKFRLLSESAKNNYGLKAALL
jgi:hypothetical protein